MPEQAHYTEQRLKRCPHYSGPASVWDEDEASAVLVEVMHYFGLSGDLPAPPSGLPGVALKDTDEELMEVLRLGLDYVQAVAQGESRRQVNIYADARKALLTAYWRGHRKRDEEYREALRCQSEGQAAEALARDLTDNRTVYFIGSDDGLIKIGVSGDPTSRLRALQLSSPAPLRILATTAGGQPGERAYHLRFTAHRQHGEWFERHHDILAEIDRLNSHPLASAIGGAAALSGAR